MVSLINENSNKHVTSKNMPNPTNFSNLKSQNYLAIEFQSNNKSIDNSNNTFHSNSIMKNSNYISARNYLDHRIKTGREIFPQTTKTPIQLNKILNTKKMSLDRQNRTPLTCPISKNSKIEKIPQKSLDNLDESKITSSHCSNQSLRESENIQETDRPKIAHQEEINFANQNNQKKSKPTKVIIANQNSKNQQESNKENKVKEKFKINLEDTLYAEDKLWSILDAIQTGEDVLTYCREWWALMKNEGISSVEVI